MASARAPLVGQVARDGAPVPLGVTEVPGQAARALVPDQAAPGQAAQYRVGSAAAVLPAACGKSHLKRTVAETDRVHHGVVHRRANLPNGVVLARGMHPVG